MRPAALGAAATLTILVHSVISQVSYVAQSGALRTRLAQHDFAHETVVLSIEQAGDPSNARVSLAISFEEAMTPPG
jgi:hypothetical protein